MASGQAIRPVSGVQTVDKSLHRCVCCSSITAGRDAINGHHVSAYRSATCYRRCRCARTTGDTAAAMTGRRTELLVKLSPVTKRPAECLNFRHTQGQGQPRRPVSTQTIAAAPGGRPQPGPAGRPAHAGRPVRTLLLAPGAAGKLIVVHPWDRQFRHRPSSHHSRCTLYHGCTRPHRARKMDLLATVCKELDRLVR